MKNKWWNWGRVHVKRKGLKLESVSVSVTFWATEAIVKKHKEVDSS